MKLSVIIRCRNEAASLRLALEALRHQQCDFEWEILIVDNESDDDSRSIAEEFGARVISISAKEFTYGRALNLGFSESRGEIVMPLSAHSILVGPHALANAVAPFDDAKVAGARCLSTQAAASLAQWFRPVDLQKREFHSSEPSSIPVRDPDEWGGKVHPNNACSVIRKSVWQEIPFHETLETAEDKYWALQVLDAGYKIRHFAQCVFCYNRDFDDATRLARRKRELLAHYRFGKQPALSLGASARRAAKAPFISAIYGASKAAEHLRNELTLISYLHALPRNARQTEVGSKAEFTYKPRPDEATRQNTTQQE